MLTIPQKNTETIIEEGIIYRPMRIEDLHVAAICFTESFQREPMVQSLSITFDDFLPFAEWCCEEAIHQKMGLVAVDELTNQIIGFTILQDALAEVPEEVLLDFECLLPVFIMLGGLQEKYLIENNTIMPGTVAVSFVTGVKKEYQGQKVSFNLFGQSLSVAKKAGYKKMITEVTGRLSQNAARRRFGFTPYASVVYHEFQLDGQNIFSNIEDSKLSCVLMEKCLLN